MSNTDEGNDYLRYPSKNDEFLNLYPQSMLSYIVRVDNEHGPWVSTTTRDPALGGGQGTRSRDKPIDCWSTNSN